MFLKIYPGSWYRFNTLQLDISYHSKQKSKWFQNHKTRKYVTSNVYHRKFMIMSQISRFPDLFKKAMSEYLISETLFLAQSKNRSILYQEEYFKKNYYLKFEKLQYFFIKFTVQFILIHKLQIFIPIHSLLSGFQQYLQ